MAKTFADIRKQAAAAVRKADSSTATGMSFKATPDNLKAMTQDKIIVSGSKPGSKQADVVNGSNTVVNNPNNAFMIEQQGDATLQAKILAKKKHG
jgi:hypothetical protein